MTEKLHKNSHKPTEEARRQVKTLAGYGMPLEKIADLIGITFKTLKKHYSTEIDLGKAEAHAFVVNSLFQSIKNGNVTSMIFYLKTQLGWKETQVQEIKNGGGWSVSITDAQPAIDIDSTTDEKD